MREINNIQYLRGVAAIMVLIFHVSVAFGRDFPVGPAGVDVFFVISGFIMWTTTAGRPVRPGWFLWRRLTRIAPLYWVVTLVTAAMAFVKPNFFGSPSLVEVLRSLIFIPVLENHELHPFVLLGWSLSYEMMFYLILAAGLWLGDRLRFWLVLAVLTIMALIQPLMGEAYIGALFYPMVMEFAAGIVLGALWMRNIKLPGVAGLLMAAAGVALFAGEQAGIVPIQPPFGWGRVLTWGGPATLIVAGALVIERAWPRPPIRWLGFLGDASYSIYLWHGLFIGIGAGLILHLKLPPLANVFGVAALALAASVCLYVAVERRLNRVFHPKKAAPAPAPA